MMTPYLNNARRLQQEAVCCVKALAHIGETLLYLSFGTADARSASAGLDTSP